MGCRHFYFSVNLILYLRMAGNVQSLIFCHIGSSKTEIRFLLLNFYAIVYLFGLFVLMVLQCTHPFDHNISLISNKRPPMTCCMIPLVLQGISGPHQMAELIHYGDDAGKGAHNII